VTGTVGFMVRRRWPVLALVGWSAFVWITRLNNTLADDDADKPLSLALSASILVLAAASAVVLVRRRSSATTETDQRLWLAFAGWTVLVWAVRGIEITLSDHNLGFKVVHVMLGVVSVVLAAAVVGVVRRERAAEAAAVSPLAGTGR
jgi:hypothetical protein